MTEEEKFLLVNKCETPEELEAAIIALADETGHIWGKKHQFNAKTMASTVKPVIAGTIPPNFLTRSYGIRQQALYLRYYLS